MFPFLLLCLLGSEENCSQDTSQVSFFWPLSIGGPGWEQEGYDKLASGGHEVIWLLLVAFRLSLGYIQVKALYWDQGLGRLLPLEIGTLY